jgi:hypothetical protein
VRVKGKGLFSLSMFTWSRGLCVRDSDDRCAGEILLLLKTAWVAFGWEHVVSGIL